MNIPSSLETSVPYSIYRRRRYVWNIWTLVFDDLWYLNLKKLVIVLFIIGFTPAPT
jgi:hypothetical protein